MSLNLNEDLHRAVLPDTLAQEATTDLLRSHSTFLFRRSNGRDDGRETLPLMAMSGRSAVWSVAAHSPIEPARPLRPP